MQIIQARPKSASLPASLQSILPLHLLDAVSRCGAPSIEELRLHSRRDATVTCRGRNYSTHVSLRSEEMHAILRDLCQGSLYAYSESINQGFLTLPDGVRVGVCGTAAVEGGCVIGVSDVTGLILRIPHAPRVSASPILSLLERFSWMQGVLLYSQPGVGKTTLLRAAAMEAASPLYAKRTVVVDTRRELAATLTGESLTLDILLGYPKEIGIEIAVRSLGAELVICDEIGSEEDAHAILQAANCGVPLLASAHARSAQELLRRPSMARLHAASVFGAYVGLSRAPSGGLSTSAVLREAIDGGI